MKLKRLAHFACAALIAGTAYCMTFIAGCSNAHPEAEITISFDEQEYVLKYTLYRNMYPQTVQHFIELTENGFYDGTIIHNYQSNYLYGGGYDYEVEGGLTYEDAYQAGKDGDTETMLDYYEAASKEKEYATLADPANGKITPSVYTTIDDGKYSDPLDTLIGEFTSNQHKIDNGALKQTYGCLTMYYTSKSSNNSVKNKRVYLDKYGSAFGVQGDYTYNSATSLFRIYTSNPQTPASLSAYCIFGTLNNTDALDNLKTAISEKSVTSRLVKLYVDNEDRFLGANANEATYSMASTPIIIKTVKITKY